MALRNVTFSAINVYFITAIDINIKTYYQLR